MIHPLSLVIKKGSSFVYESSHGGRGRASIRIDLLGESLLSDIVRFCCIFSHYIYHGLVTTFTYIIVSLEIYIYIFIYNVFFFTFILHVLFLFSLYIHMSSFIQLVYVSHLMP